MNYFNLPVEDLTNRFVDNWLLPNTGGFFEGISKGLGSFIDLVTNTLLYIPAELIAIIFILIAWKASGKGLAIFMFAGLLYIGAVDLWEASIQTLAIVIVSTVISVLFGVPVGILAALNKTVDRIIRPILDFMQTLPSFVYLIPAILLFGLGSVPAVIATFIFATPPAVRMTSLGVKQVPKDVIEASKAFGSTRWQLLTKIQFPLAVPTIMAGVNQTMMLALSMAVIASMIGAPGLGTIVLTGISTVNVGLGLTGGLAIVVLAIILDRITQSLGKNYTKIREISLKKLIIGSIVALVVIVSVTLVFGDKKDVENDGETITLGVTPWSSTIPPTEIARLIIEDMGYTVKEVKADAGNIFIGLSRGDIDVLMDSWLPAHELHLEKYKDTIEDTAISYDNVATGITVPTYMEDINSVEDLKGKEDLFKGELFGIEDGASATGIINDMIADYGLGLTQVNSSEGGMLAQVQRLMETEQPVAFFGWRPHTMFNKFDLKVLEDEKGHFEMASVHVITNNKLSEKASDVHQFLSNWSISIDDVEDMIAKIENEGADAKVLAREWIDNNQDKVNEMIGK